jgi:hypothetical protein
MRIENIHQCMHHVPLALSTGQDSRMSNCTSLIRRVPSEALGKAEGIEAVVPTRVEKIDLDVNG